MNLKNRYMYLLIIIAAASRLLPHPENFTAVGALALFSGACIRDKGGYAVPLAALGIGDLVAGLYAPLVMASVYVGFALSAAAGAWLLGPARTLLRYALAVGVSALAFYAVTNLSVWYQFYAHSPQQLLQCYLNGLPFLARSVAGDAFYSILMFGTWEVCSRLAGAGDSQANAQP